jgi:chitodextrinase
MRIDRKWLVVFVVTALVAAAPATARAELVLVELASPDGVPLVAAGDAADGPFDEEETRKRVRARERAIARARAALLASLPADVAAAIYGEYRHFPLLRADVDAAQRRALEAHPLVVAVHADRQRRPSTDSSLAYLGASVWHGEGWTGEGTAVAVLDSGIRYWNGFFGDCPEAGHEGCRVAVFEGFAHLTWGSGSTDPREVAEQSSHGTNVGGIVGDVAPGTSLLSLGVFGYYEPDEESGFRGDVLANDGDVAAALDWCIEHRDEHNIVAANMSLGSAVDSTETGYCSGPQAGAYDAVFANTRDAGVLPVVASGNEYSKTAISSPACVPSAVAVGAGYDDPAFGLSCGTGPVVPGAVTCFSNSNALVALVAPGNDIDAGGIPGLSGTSMAAPHVAGLVAVYQARYLTTPVWTLERLRADAVVIAEIGPDQLYLHRSARLGDHEAELTFDSGALLASDYDGLPIPDGSGAPLTVATEVVCESELCASGIDLVVELEAPDGATARHEMTSDDELGVEHVHSILGSQHLAGVFADLSGAPVEGTWTLRVFDDERGREGRLYRAALLLDSARVELRGVLDAPAVARPDEPFDVTVRLENAGNLAIDAASLTVELVTDGTGEVVDSAPIELDVPSAPGATAEDVVALAGPQGSYEVRLAGTLAPEVTPGLVVEARRVDVTYRTFATFVVEPAAPVAGERARLRVISRGMVESAAWELGDGATAATVEATHVWLEPGDYEVRLSVEGPDGASATARTVTVVAPPAAPPSTERPLDVGGGGCNCRSAGGGAGSGGAGLALALLAALGLRAARRGRGALRALAPALAVAFASACWDDERPPPVDPGDADVGEVVPPEDGPWLSLLDPVDPTVGDPVVFVMLSSPEPSTCDVALEVIAGDGEPAPATFADETPATGLAAAPDGVEHALRWLATSDIAGDEAAVRLRARAVCDGEETLPVVTGPFRVLNFFVTNPDAVLVSEVSAADENVPAETNADYVELVNTTSEEISLDGWLLLVGSAGGARREHPLDGARLAPRGRLVVVEAGGDLPGAFELAEELPWTVETNGWVGVLASEARGVDFVRWGGSPAVPPAALAWSDDPPLPIPQTLTVLARAGADDTDRSSDFCVARPTPGDDNGACVRQHEASDLLITELDSQGMFDQVEVLNDSAEPVDLGGWVLKWDGDDLGAGHVPIASVELEPGERVVLRDNGEAGLFYGGILDLGQNLNIDGLVPIALALQDPHGRVVDFLAGGGSPIRWVDWTEDAPTPMPGPNTTLSRRPGDPDTDSAADFCLTADNLLEGAAECLEPIASNLVISEVMPGRPDWIELYNPGPDAVDLSQLYLSYTSPYYGGSVGDYLLRGVLEPLDFVVVTERRLDTVPDAIVLGGENIALAPEGPGSVAIRDLHGFGVDFVMWGEPAGRPLWPDVWLGLGYTTHAEDDFISLQRFPHSGPDTDSVAGWCWAYPSPGGPNATCERGE